MLKRRVATLALLLPHQRQQDLQQAAEQVSNKRGTETSATRNRRDHFLPTSTFSVALLPPSRGAVPLPSNRSGCHPLSHGASRATSNKGGTGPGQGMDRASSHESFSAARSR